MFETKQVEYKKHNILESEHPLRRDLHLAVEIGRICGKNRILYSFELNKEDCLVISFHENIGIITIDEKTLSPNIKTTLILMGKHRVELNLNYVEFEYCLIKGKMMTKILEKDFYILDSIAYKKVYYFYSSIYSSLTKYKTCDIFMNSSSVYRFFSDILHINIDKDSKKSLLVKKAVDYIEEHFQEDINLDDICKYLGYSKYYILHVFQEIMEISVHDFVVRRRLTEVKSLLLEDKLSIEEIAQSCGFKSDIALYKAFKRIYSITPGQFKKMNTMKNEEQKNESLVRK